MYVYHNVQLEMFEGKIFKAENFCELKFQDLHTLNMLENLLSLKFPVVQYWYFLKVRMTDQGNLCAN